MWKCIYCRCESAIRFPAEHVIPRSFGKFRQNLTIHCVCGECNNFFSRNLELRFARDTGEGVIRYRHRLRESPAYGSGVETFTATIKTPGPLFGAEVRLTASNSESGVGLDWVPQVGFEEEGSGDFHWFTEDRLSPEHLKGIRFGSKVLFISANREARERIRARLIELGFQFTGKQKRDDVAAQTLFDTRVKWLFDSTIRRCVAKIAFNHLAYIAEQNYEFLGREDFDEVRDYIRAGSESDERDARIVHISGEPRLGFSSPPPLGGGHLIVTSWDTTNQAIISQLSIFGALNYTVILASSYKGVWFDIRGGHCFDVTRKEVRTARITRFNNLRLSF